MTICKSADQKLEQYIATKGEETSFHRVEAQKAKCSYGLQGVCCKLCSNGPCKITKASPRGVCGATADTIVARNFLRSVAAGSACYIHIIEKTAKNLITLGEQEKTLRGASKLHELAALLNLNISEKTTNHQIAVQVGQKILADLYKAREEKMELVAPLAHPQRYDKWQELNIVPGGAKAEVFDAIVKTSTNLNSDPIDMLLHALSLGISTGLYGLTLTNLVNDVIMGEPVIRQASVGFKVVDENYINIMITGHQHSMLADLQDRLTSPEALTQAQEVGAQGFKIIGSTCVGQDLQVRGEHCKEVFAGHTGNNFTSEPLITTGAIDLLLSEFNCTVPGLEPLVEKYKVKQICLDDVAKTANAIHNPFTMEKAATISEYIMEQAIKSYKERRSQITIDIPKDHGYDDVVTGLSEKSLRQFLGNSWQPLIELIAAGKIKGLAAVVGCSNVTNLGHDVFTVGLTEELIKNDILVLSAGCSSGGLENVGLMSPSAAAKAGANLREVCESLGIPPVLNFGPCLAIGRLEMIALELAEALNIDIPQLPLVLSAPQWLEEQALADGAFGLALGLPLHLASPPFITGSDTVTKVLTEDLKSLTGGYVIVEGNIESAGAKLNAIIEERRTALGL
ncbi:anaerobic carbon-monoxide dehydrogenase catalytic subunit [Heliorestis acidaminivorans]|uniref:Carbon monoxide dehydrogenase n=1 Tax=Heliorestis acidaminivorans TaxID=553427 RepID=A0A6I0F579_9FIRM|nr:anaerobic carbon-monoxide dehydrogenase catalytic subunit [Heliorestis acidaminivorans]KAB2953837.1 anaerobic carbon-monoxide dehydrogenase catalytic subunit [Heliorestis acidaminivorans]